MLRHSPVLLLCCSILACSDEIESAWMVQEQGNPMEVEKKYYLKDCITKIAFEWDEELLMSRKYQIIDEVLHTMKFAVLSGDYPLFSASATREATYIVIYYSDRCEDRIGMTNKLIKEYFLTNVPSFPDFSIETKVKPGFDGSKPSGWWLDD